MAPRDDGDRAAQNTARCVANGPTAVSARYDRRIGRIVVRLSSGLQIAFAPKEAEGLENAKPAQLNEIEISPSGYGSHFPELDADLYIPALLRGSFGSARWMAERARQANSGSAGGNGGTARRGAKKITAL